jgi:putative FmdB family regulatory protein
MPAYDYLCRSCGEESEIIKPMSEFDADEFCACGNLMRKRFVPVSVSFKGSGFYRTDSRTSHVSSKLKAGNVG